MTSTDNTKKDAEPQQQTTQSQIGSTISQWTSSAASAWPSAKVATIGRVTSLFKGSQEPIVFPPPEWALPENEIGKESVQLPESVRQSSTNASKAKEGENNSEDKGTESKVVEEEKPTESGDKAEPTPEAPPADSKQSQNTDEPPPEPTTLAKRIRSLVGNMPKLSGTNTSTNPPSTTPEPPKSPEPVVHDGPINLNGPDGPPLPSFIGHDSKLMKWLSSENVMNGSLAKGTESVWEALEALKKPKETAGREKEQKTDEESSSEEDESGDEDHEDSFMIYAPLQPGNGSQVELADSEAGVAEQGEKEQPASPVEPGKAKKDTKAKKNKKTKKAKKPQRVWKPHPTELSLEAMWWGYRLYLPPAVLNILDSNHLKAAQRASMITTSLKWILDQIPALVVPPQYRPAVSVVKSLAPYLGYMGVVITWSWGKIKAMDEGNGVILTATWLLPVALIPSTWKPGQPATKELSPKEAAKVKAALDKLQTPEEPPQTKRTNSLNSLAKKYFGGKENTETESGAGSKKGKEKA